MPEPSNPSDRHRWRAYSREVEVCERCETFAHAARIYEAAPHCFPTVQWKDTHPRDDGLSRGDGDGLLYSPQLWAHFAAQHGGTGAPPAGAAPPVLIKYPGEQDVIIMRPALRRVLRQHRVRQNDIATSAGVSRGAVSDQLNERSAAVSQPVADAIGTLIGSKAGAWQDLAMAAIGAGAPPAGATPTGTGAHIPRATNGGNGGADADTVAGAMEAAEDAAAAEPRIAFPLRDVHKAITAAREMIVEGTVEAVAGFRKLLTIERAWRAYHAAGVDPDAALDAAWAVSVSGKETGENRTQLAEVYRATFGRAPVLPARIPSLPAGGVHPDVAAGWPLLRAGMHVWYGGEAGGGKSYGARLLASHLEQLDSESGAPVAGQSRNVWILPGNKRLEPEDLLGTFDTPEKGRIAFRDGMGVLAMRWGGVLIVEEPDRAEPEALTIMHQMLEEREIYIPATGERVTAAPGFVVISCANSLGGGEGRYATNYMDPAFMDRFAVIEVGHMPPAMEMRIIAKRIQDAGYDIR